MPEIIGLPPKISGFWVIRFFITLLYHDRKRGKNPSFEILKGLCAALKVKSSEILPF